MFTRPVCGFLLIFLAAFAFPAEFAMGDKAGVKHKLVGLERLKSDDPDDRIAALSDLLRSDDKAFVRRVLEHVAKTDPDARVRNNAVRLLESRGIESRDPPTPAIIRPAPYRVRPPAIDNITLFKNAERLRNKMIALMNRAVEDPNPEIRRSAAIWVARFNPRGPARPTALLEMLENGTDEERRLAADALAARHDPADAVAAQWAMAMDDRDPQVRSVAIGALGSLGDAAKPAEKKLIQFVADPANPYARAAAFVLLRLGPDGRSAAVGYLAKSLSVGSAEERDQAVRALATAGAEARLAVPALVAMLADAGNELRIDAAMTLGAIGPDAKSALPALTRMADNRHVDVRSAAVAALTKIDPQGQSLGPALFAAVLNKDRAACGVLAGPMKKAGTPREVFRRLEDIAADDPDDGVRETARAAAEELGAQPTPTNGKQG
ncbi:MAG: repeat-containing protein [Phycisphaerales bacterium]|nr:repeat-containing protein [Phycisphaerales bacterium]